MKEKPRNGGTMTEAAFWGSIRAALRNRFRRMWVPRRECLLSSRKSVTGHRHKYEYKCVKCKKYFRDKQVEVDHIIPCGSLKCAKDLAGFIKRLFVEKEGLQVLCKPCHKIKTAEERQRK